MPGPVGGGQRTDLKAEGQAELLEGGLPQSFAEVGRGETAEIAAKGAGFGNPETYLQAKALAARKTGNISSSTSNVQEQIVRFGCLYNHHPLRA